MATGVHDNGLYDVTTLSISDQTKEFKTRTFFSIYLPNFCSCKIENRTKNRLRIIQVFFLAKCDMVTLVVKKKAANYKMLISRTPPTVLILKFLVKRMKLIVSACDALLKIHYI